MKHYIINIKETTRGLVLEQEMKTLESLTIEEIESAFKLNKTFTSNDFVEYYEICEVEETTGEVVVKKHFDTGYKMENY